MTTKPKKAKKSPNPKASNRKSTKAPKPTKSAHVPTPWARLKKLLWEAGASYEAMAKATDAHYDPTKPDPTKPTRAKIWKARNIGVTIDGKLVKFGARGKAKEPAKKSKPSKAVKKGPRKGKTTKKATKTTATGDAKTEQSNPGQESTETSD